MLMKIIFYFALLVFAIWGYKSVQASKPTLKIGAPAPDFQLQDALGKIHRLQDYRGKWVVLYFYPKDDTPGCTKEACQFRDDLHKLTALGAEVIGVSVDNDASHKAFAEKYHLPFPLLSDSNGEVAAKYGALTDLVLVKIAKRYTFLINPNGVLEKTYFNVDTSKHSQQIIDDLNNLANNK